MALEGGVPALYAPPFAVMQVTLHSQIQQDVRFERAVDDAGRFLDACGHEADRLGWSPAALFDASGLVWALNGRSVVALSSTAATRSDGQVYIRGLLRALGS